MPVHEASCGPAQVPAGIRLPDYAETATPTSELENKQQRIGAPSCYSQCKRCTHGIARCLCLQQRRDKSVSGDVGAQCRCERRRK